jgi:hypothetical protein
MAKKQNTGYVDKQARSTRVNAKTARVGPPTEKPKPKTRTAEPTSAEHARLAELGIQITNWNGHVLYQDATSPFNAFSVGDVLAHRQKTRAGRAPQLVDTGLVSPSGNTIVKEV